MELTQVLQIRRSTKSFSTKPVSREALSDNDWQGVIGLMPELAEANR